MIIPFLGRECTALPHDRVQSCCSCFAVGQHFQAASLNRTVYHARDVLIGDVRRIALDSMVAF